MEEFRVTCINKPQRDGPVEAITHLGGSGWRLDQGAGGGAPRRSSPRLLHAGGWAARRTRGPRERRRYQVRPDSRRRPLEHQPAGPARVRRLERLVRAGRRWLDDRPGCSTEGGGAGARGGALARRDSGPQRPGAQVTPPPGLRRRPVRTRWAVVPPGRHGWAPGRVAGAAGGARRGPAGRSRDAAANSGAAGCRSRRRNGGQSLEPAGVVGHPGEGVERGVRETRSPPGEVAHAGLAQGQEQVHLLRELAREGVVEEVARGHAEQGGQPGEVAQGGVVPAPGAQLPQVGGGDGELRRPVARRIASAASR